MTMKLKSAAGLVCYVKNVPKSVKFYETVGFTFKKSESTRATGYINWFWIDLLQIGKEDRAGFKVAKTTKNKGEGYFVYLSVDDVDEDYKSMVSKGLKQSKPKDTEWGNRECLLKDPDGYMLVIFKKK